MDDGSRAALDLHQWDLIFCCHHDVVFMVEDGGQVHAPDGIDEQKGRYIIV